MTSVDATAPSANLYDTQGPTFSIEPPHIIEFINTLGYRIDCTANGNPQPNIEWYDQDNNSVNTIQNVSFYLKRVLYPV